MALPGTLHDNRQRVELDLLVSMYPTECQRNFTEDGGDFQCSLQAHPLYKLELSLPAKYPDSAPPNTYLQCGDTVSTADRKTARGKLAEITEHSWKRQEGECLDVLVEEFTEWMKQFILNPSIQSEGHSGTSDVLIDVGSIASRSATASHNGHSNLSSQAANLTIKRTLLWSHHLLATSKRKDIVTWSRELHLNGFSRPGYPGAIFVEGDVESVDEFVQRIKGLRWQALQVRAERSAESRVCGDGVDGVVEVESLGEVVERLRMLDESVAEMFLEGMKFGR